MNFRPFLCEFWCVFPKENKHDSHWTFVLECPCEKFINWPFFGFVCRGHSWPKWPTCLCQQCKWEKSSAGRCHQGSMPNLGTLNVGESSACNTANVDNGRWIWRHVTHVFICRDKAMMIATCSCRAVSLISFKGWRVKRCTVWVGKNQ